MTAITIVPWDVIVNIIAYVVFPAVVLILGGAFVHALWKGRKAS